MRKDNKIFKELLTKCPAPLGGRTSNKEGIFHQKKKWPLYCIRYHSLSITNGERGF
jgi:hypothetical protein